MLWLPILSLALAMSVVVAAFALMFFRVAFAEALGGVARPSAGWELPTLTGDRLRTWAANLARRVVARHAHQPRSAETPLSIATELEAGANAVLEQAAVQSCVAVAKSCPNARPQQVAVTAPEVFAIVAELERSFPKPEQQLIREHAVINARRARFIVPEEFPQAGVGCPLRSKNGECLTFASRPIACRRLCSDGQSGCSGGACCGGGSMNAPFELTDQFHEGMSDGLSEGLREAGLDDGIYELNDALATVMATPHAAARWSRGEPIFANCVKA